jgi:hypothetical protein
MNKIEIKLQTRSKFISIEYKQTENSSQNKEYSKRVYLLISSLSNLIVLIVTQVAWSTHHSIVFSTKSHIVTTTTITIAITFTTYIAINTGIIVF